MRVLCTILVFFILASQSFAQDAWPSRFAWISEACGHAHALAADTCHSRGPLSRGQGRPIDGDLHGALGPRLTVRVYNYARVRPSTLLQGEREAAAIFRQAGVETDWINCRIPGVPGESSCRTPFGAADLQLRIVPAWMAERLGLRGAILGFALGSQQGYGGFVASVFYNRVETLAAEGGFPESHLLALVSAHELGHLLLPSAGHAAKGIMRGQWSYDDLRLDRSGYLLFGPAEHRPMKENVL